MADQDDSLIVQNDRTECNETDENALDSYIEELRTTAGKIRNGEMALPKGQRSGVLLIIVAIGIIFLVLLKNLDDIVFYVLFTGATMIRCHGTARITMAKFYDEAAEALDSYHHTGNISGSESEEEAAAYVDYVVEFCQNRLSDEAIRTPEQWHRSVWSKKQYNTA